MAKLNNIRKCYGFALAVAEIYRPIWEKQGEPIITYELERRCGEDGILMRFGLRREKPPVLSHRGLSAVRKKRGRKEVPKEAAHGFRVPLYGIILVSAFERKMTALKTKSE